MKDSLRDMGRLKEEQESNQYQVSKDLPRSSPSTVAYMDDGGFLFNLIRRGCLVMRQISEISGSSVLLRPNATLYRRSQDL
jgi:hypothetical protein